MTIEIDFVGCTHCDLCAQVCPAGIIALGPSIRADRHPFCIECGSCFAACPVEVITVLGLVGAPSEEITGALLKPDSLLHLLRARRSRRHYKDVPVTREHLEAILAAASCAPSSSNGRTIKAYVYSDQTRIERIRQATLASFRSALKMVSLPGFGIVWKFTRRPPEQLELLRKGLALLTQPEPGKDSLFYHAPTLMAFTAPRRWTETHGDAFLYAQNAVIYAESIPVANCYNGYLTAACDRDRKVQDAMEIPRGERVVAALTLGYSDLTYARTAPRKMIPTVWK